MHRGVSARINQSAANGAERLVFMNARNKRLWSDLCGEAEVEEDLEKLQKLAEQITRILDDEQARLKSLQIKLKQNP
jgi:hypothetical protein